MSFLTTTQVDPEHQHYVAAAIAALETGELKWRHHGIGVLQAYVDEGDDVEHRLHIWSRWLVKNGIDTSGDMHDHRFDMVSHVLFGTIHQVECELTPAPQHGQWTTMTLINARAAGEENNHHAPMTPTGERYEMYPRLTVVRAGHRYTFPARRFHRSVPTGFAITWVEKHNQTDTPARVAHPIDIPAVQAFGHEMDLAQATFLVELALDCLRRMRR